MPEIQGTNLFQKLDAVGWKALERAHNACEKRRATWVELYDWLSAILEGPPSDLHLICAHSALNVEDIKSDLAAARTSDSSRGASSPEISGHIWTAVERGWVYATLLYGELRVRTGHVLVGILKDNALRARLLSLSAHFESISLDELTDQNKFSQIVKDSTEENQGPTDGSFQSVDSSSASSQPAAGEEGQDKRSALARFSVDLTERARKGEIDPVLGRDSEIRQVIDILMRRRQNNPILTGEAGVGKTAIVEGFAVRVAQGDVPPALQGVTVRALDIGLLQAGASMKGEFEKRLRQVVEEVQQAPKPIILFIDEAHMLVGAGGPAGQGDAANLLKPALARGTLRTIAATTWGEYREYIEKDPALSRRFHVIKVAEPTEDQAVEMVRGTLTVLQQHHQVRVLDEAVRDAVKLSHRYIPVRQLPDKAVSLLDTACARVGVSQHATPPLVEDYRRRISILQTELQVLEREESLGIEHQKRLKEVKAELDQSKTSLSGIETRWQKEKKLVSQILGLIEKAQTTSSKPSAAQTVQASSASPDPPAETQNLSRTLNTLKEELRLMQGQDPLIHPWTDAQAIASVVSDWTGIPVRRMVRNEIEAILHLTDTLEKRVVGQRHALELIVERIQTARAETADPNKPVGVFLLAGPSGVGKTETALALSEALYGGEQNLITINMSEFQEAHTVSTLKGAPPGYVGYGKGGVLTEAVRRRPYSVILLDEVEKAHPDVNEIFYQVFDKGRMEDAEGRLIDFKNTIMLLTTNLGSELIMSFERDPATMPEPPALADALRDQLIEQARQARQSGQVTAEGRVFTPAFLGRLIVVPYYPLGSEILRSIIRLQLARIARRLAENHEIQFEYDASVLDLVASRCTSRETGARMVDSILTHTLLPAITRELLTRRLQDDQARSNIRRIVVGVKDSSFDYRFVDAQSQ